MATDFYGSCTGNSSSKYDIWIKVKQNSQDIGSNKSNVSVTMYLKRNDGYAGSAYNINTSANTAKLTVGGVVKVNKNLAIDTRNGATVTLASWTGDVAHSADGTLSLAVSGSFTITGSSGLSGGSAKGSFKCTTIPRKSTLSLSLTTVSPGGSVTAAITPCSNNFSHKIKFKIGEKSKTISLDKTMLSSSFSVPLDWAGQVTSSRSGTITVTLTTYNGSSSIGSVSYNLKLQIPDTDEYRPDFSLSVSRVDNNVPAEWGEYVQGESQVNVAVSDIVTKQGAQNSSCSITVGKLTASAVSKVFSLPDSGEINISVTVKDSRGLKKTKTEKITVLPYSPPSVIIKSLKRCNQQGDADIYGTSALVEYELSYSSVNGKNTCNGFCKRKSNNNALFTQSVSLGASPCVVFPGEIVISDTYAFSFGVEDGIYFSDNQVLRYLSSSNIPFNIKRGGNGASFGKFAENDDCLSVGWNIQTDKSITSEGEINGKGGLKGELYSENIVCFPSASCENLMGEVKYFPGIRAVYVNIRVTVKTALNANEKGYIATVSSAFPAHFTPLESFVNGDEALLSKGGIFSDTGEIFVSPNKSVPVGRYIYVNGFYIVNN